MPAHKRNGCNMIPFLIVKYSSPKLFLEGVEKTLDTLLSQYFREQEDKAQEADIQQTHILWVLKQDN